MRSDSRRLRPGVVLAILGVLAAVALVVSWQTRGRDGPLSRAGEGVAAAPPGGAPEDASRSGGTPSAVPASPEDAASAPRLSDVVEGLTDPGSAWARVDMEAAREAMPDNLYWKMGMPTNDPQVIREREEERARWNDEYGKVLSNTATEEEIRRYYAHRYRLSTDYIEFANYLLDHHGDDIPERDVGLLELSVELHMARLEQVPREEADAYERKRAHDAAREAWLADQARFESGAETGPED